MTFRSNTEAVTLGEEEESEGVDVGSHKVSLCKFTAYKISLNLASFSFILTAVNLSSKADLEDFVSVTHNDTLLFTGNHSPHGHAASIWTEDLTLALETAKGYIHTQMCLLYVFIFPSSFVTVHLFRLFGLFAFSFVFTCLMKITSFKLKGKEDP